MNISTLAEQFGGRKFGELVLEHCRKTDGTHLAKALLVSTQELSVQAKTCVNEQMKTMNEQAMNAEFWQADCGDFLMKVANDARRKMAATGHQASDDEIFSVFQTISLSFANACSGDAKAKTFVQKSIGVGFFSRLFG